MHSNTENILAAIVLTSWFWGLVYAFLKTGPEIVSAIRFNRTFKRVKAGVSATGYHLADYRLEEATRQLLDARATVKNGPLTYHIDHTGKVVRLDVDPEWSTIPCGHIVKQQNCAHCQSKLNGIRPAA